MAAAPTTAELTKRFKESYLAAMPHLLQDYLDLVRSSDSPKDKLEALQLGVKLHGMEPKNDVNASLPTFNITFQMNGVQAEKVVDLNTLPHTPADVPALPEPDVVDAVVTKAEPFILDIAPID